MGVVCKLNPAMASGEQGRPFVLSRMYEIYLEVHARGLSDWEFNTRQMLDRVKHRHTLCPQNRDCDSGIRCLQPEGDYYSCGSFADDRDYSIDFDAEMESSVPLPPLRNEFELQFLKSECLGCPMFEICNGCRKTIKDMKRSALVEEHCAGMKRIAPRVLALGASGGGRS
jgi:radical SAM protein with 4Fe4S-binding SPASM domain